jgi:carboxypeptidase T
MNNLPYLSVTAIEQALANAAVQPAATSKVAPHPTWDGRTVGAVTIGVPGSARVAVYFIGGVHAREWGSPDILINFIDLLLLQQATTIGGYSITATQLQDIIQDLDVIVLPQVNPDGRDFSMLKVGGDPMWRKNRRPPLAPPGNCPTPGVDINRNFDFLWDFVNYFAPRPPPPPNSPGPNLPTCAGSSKTEADEIFIGPDPASEPETQNVVALADANLHIRYFVDLHSYGEQILYSWGDDDDQSDDPTMNFQNPAYNGKRGKLNTPDYGEYITPSDKKAATDAATAMRQGIAAVRGRNYTVVQATSLPAKLFPISGASDDYHYSRKSLGQPKVLAFTVEWGSGSNTDPYHPPAVEMDQIGDEVTAGLFAFCLHAREKAYPVLTSTPTYSTGDPVTLVQTALNGGGYGPLNVDGVFGPLTSQAVKGFQKRHPPLQMDGVVGPHTWRSLHTTP